MHSKRSGLVFGVCLFAAACTNNAEDRPATVAGQQTAPSVAASATTETSPPSLLVGYDAVEPGVYGVDLVGASLEITVPAGWTRVGDYAIGGPEDSYISFLDVTDVYNDGCNWVDGKFGIGPSVEDFVAGLVAQKGLETTAPEPLTVDGFSGLQLVTTASANLDFSTCYAGSFATFTNDLTHQIRKSKPGEATTICVLDLNGRRGVIAFGAPGPTSASTTSQIEAMVGAIKID
jgi:hypothetical protein